MSTTTPASTDVQTAAMAELRQIVGPSGWSTDADILAIHATDWTGARFASTPLLLKPASAHEVSQIVGTCRAAGLKIVPQGGNTSLAGGSVPTGDGIEIVVNLSRMNRVREIDTFNDTMTVDAGCILSSLQEEAERVSRLFPLRLASQGSCQIGGNIATNAGGTNVVRYGNTRDLVLGLEVVLPDGRILSGLRGLRKDNTGYDLKQLFIGSEGTLGIITGAVLKLFPRPTAIGTAICALPDLASALDVLSLCKEKTGGQVTAFELMPRQGLELVFKHFPAQRFPLAKLHDWQLLIEFSSSEDEAYQQERIEAVLSEAFENGWIVDAAIATSIDQSRAFWGLREGLAQADMMEGALVSGDVSVPLSAVPDFIEQCSAEVLALIPEGRVVAFGHLGDGNIHYGLLQPEKMTAAEFLVHEPSVKEVIYRHALSAGGSTSAEHGLGSLKNEAVKTYRGDVDHDLMVAIKAAIDPHWMFNPGKVLKRDNA
jgi:FAD/FMN-containing dehydrogenase